MNCLKSERRELNPLAFHWNTVARFTLSSKERASASRLARATQQCCDRRFKDQKSFNYVLKGAGWQLGNRVSNDRKYNTYYVADRHRAESSKRRLLNWSSTSGCVGVCALASRWRQHRSACRLSRRRWLTSRHVLSSRLLIRRSPLCLVFLVALLLLFCLVNLEEAEADKIPEGEELLYSEGSDVVLIQMSSPC